MPAIGTECHKFDYLFAEVATSGSGLQVGCIQGGTVFQGVIDFVINISLMVWQQVAAFFKVMQRCGCVYVHV